MVGLEPTFGGWAYLPYVFIPVQNHFAVYPQVLFISL
jgi:hypothetical protein